MADDTESLHDLNWFQLTGPVFVVAPVPRPQDYEKLLLSFARVQSADADGIPGCPWPCSLTLILRSGSSLKAAQRERRNRSVLPRWIFSRKTCALSWLSESHISTPGRAVESFEYIYPDSH